MGRPSRRILDLRKAAHEEMTDTWCKGGSIVLLDLATELAAEFGVTLEVALHQVKRVNYQHCHNGKLPHRGQPNDTALHLGPPRCAWLKAKGGKQPTIKRLIDEAMKKDGN